MTDPQRERVARVVDEHAIDYLAGAIPAPRNQKLGRGNQTKLAIVRAGSVLPSSIERLLHHRFELALCQRVEHQSLQHMAGDERGLSLQRLVDRGDRVADVCLELLERDVVAPQCESVSAGYGNAAQIVLHDSIFLLACSSMRVTSPLAWLSIVRLEATEQGAMNVILASETEDGDVLPFEELLARQKERALRQFERDMLGEGIPEDGRAKASRMASSFIDDIQEKDRARMHALAAEDEARDACKHWPARR